MDEIVTCHTHRVSVVFKQICINILKDSIIQSFVVISTALTGSWFELTQNKGCFTEQYTKM